MKDIITIGTVNFAPAWGNKEHNFKRILEYTEAAGRQGVQLLVFPETALTGYDVEEQEVREERMHRKLAETAPGKATDAVAELAKKYDMYVIFGMAERDSEDTTKVYNAAAVVGPDGFVGTARKIHLPFTEGLWADNGKEPFLFDTPWGPIGVGICYDFYCFPEITRYARAKGARVFVNCTAIATAESMGAGGYTGNIGIKYAVSNNAMFVVSSNLCGRDHCGSWFMGGSGVAGPSHTTTEVFRYSGKWFLEDGADESGLQVVTVDLSDVNANFLSCQWPSEAGSGDWKPENYVKWFENVK